MHFQNQKSTPDLSTRIVSCFAQVFCLSGLNSLNVVFHCCIFGLLISDANGQAKELPTYKDNDFINDGQKIYIDDENKKMFLEKLRKDVEVGVEVFKTPLSAPV